MPSVAVARLGTTWPLPVWRHPMTQLICSGHTPRIHAQYKTFQSISRRNGIFSVIVHCGFGWHTIELILQHQSRDRLMINAWGFELLSCRLLVLKHFVSVHVLQCRSITFRRIQWTIAHLTASTVSEGGLILFYWAKEFRESQRSLESWKTVVWCGRKRDWFFGCSYDVWVLKRWNPVGWRK